MERNSIYPYLHPSIGQPEGFEGHPEGQKASLMKQRASPQSMSPEGKLDKLVEREFRGPVREIRGPI